MRTEHPEARFRPLMGPCAIAIIVILASSGCAGRGGRRPFGGTPEGTTIGRDLSRLPRGSVAPATSLGVDLVRIPQTKSGVDPEARPAVFGRHQAP